MSWLPAILAIGVLIVVHEAGHFVVARLCGMKVERFSIGFGPAVLSRRFGREQTLFQVAPIPFGGFVEIKGMNVLDEVEPDDRTAYPNRPAWQRFATIFAGPATNYLFAVVLALGLFTCAGVRKPVDAYDTVRATHAGFDAHGKLQPGDRIVAVDGQPYDRHLSKYLTEDAARVYRLTVERGGERVEVPLKPVFDAEHKKLRLGVSFEDRAQVGFGTAVARAVEYPVVQTEAIVVGLYQWATGQQEGRMSSVVGITQVVADAIEVGWIEAVSLLMLLNVYLGLFNLFPLPALDGGRLVFLGYEMVTRRRANPKLEAAVHMAGVMVLAVLLVVVTISDIYHL
jgi:regulator of sigma E protease